MFEGVTVIFLAQFFGIDLPLQQQIVVMLVCILGGIGTAGVHAGSLPVIALILASVGVPPGGIGLILGEIGRASCRERVCQHVSISVVDGALKTQITRQYMNVPGC